MKIKLFLITRLFLFCPLLLYYAPLNKWLLILTSYYYRFVTVFL